jgi:Tol biopolymer transport system component/predicted Ser/Thr protein kinase
MTPERWQQIDKLLEQALEQQRGNRNLFLDSACAGDEELRREVETLLKAHDRGGSLLSSPALAAATQKPADPLQSLMGLSVGHYQILSRLGEGGMGIVYKARDQHLDRFVAIKLLPPELMADPDRKRRFVQEAKAASALNHPNIITVHDISSDNGRDFMVMEYVDGKTLDRLIPRRGLKLSDVLKYGIQISDALVKAHAAGIVHRDMKPGNIMVSEGGLVKLLDFGLAKLTERPRVEENESTLTLQPQTEEGMILGTASYMSPEQAAGKPVDARSDIFSFGSVLYEMVTGQRAFQGDSKMSTLAAILNQEPRSAGKIARTLPYDLEKIIARCLRKDTGRRSQSMADVKVALEELKEETDSGSLRATEVAGHSGKSGRFSTAIWATVAVTVAGLAMASWFWLSRSGTVQPEAALTTVPLTSYPGWEDSPSFSPDGNQVAFSWARSRRNEDADIYVKQIGIEAPSRFSDHPAPDLNPVWSPDGRTIAFVRVLSASRVAYLVKPQRGGSERTIAELDVFSTLSSQFGVQKWCDWTPDSKSLVVAGKSAPQASDALFLVSLETLEKRQLTDPPAGLADLCPAMSPDGRTLAFSRGNFSTRVDLNLVSLSEEMRPQGEPKTFAFDKLWNLFPAWTSDGCDIVFVSCNSRFDMNLWRMAVSKSVKPHRLALGAAWVPAVSRQGNRLAYSTSNVDTNIWRLEVPPFGGKPGEPAKILDSTFLEGEPAYSPDGRKIAFMSSRSGSWEIWVSMSDGSYPEQLTHFGGPKTFRPRWSPDGKQIAFYSDVKGNRDVYVIRSDGRVPRQLTTSPASDGDPGWSADGKWVYFNSDRAGEHEVWKVSVVGGEAVSVSRLRGNAPMESPDGKFLYYSKGWPDNYSIWRVPTSGGAESLAVDSLHPEGGWQAVNNGIYFISRPDAKGVPHIEFKDLTRGEVRTIAPMKGPPWWGLAVSPDRHTVLYSQSDDSGSDLMLVENFR